MSFASTHAALQLSNVTPGQKLVLAAIASFERAGKCWPSVATLAKRASMGIRTCQRHLAALVNMGYITRTYRAGHAAVTRLFIGQTPAKLAPPPLPNWHPESGIPESVNGITAPPAAAAGAAFVAHELPQEPPKPAIEPSRTVDGSMALPEVAQAITGQSDAPAPTAHEPVTVEPVSAQVVEENPLGEVPPTLMQDWAEVRKHKKKAPKPTRTEASVLAQEAVKAGLNVKDVILLCVLRGWSRFEASWIAHVPPQVVAQGPQAVFVPEPLPVATPSVVSAAREKLAELRAQILADAARRREEMAIRR